MKKSGAGIIVKLKGDRSTTGLIQHTDYSMRHIAHVQRVFLGAVKCKFIELSVRSKKHTLAVEGA